MISVSFSAFLFPLNAAAAGFGFDSLGFWLHDCEYLKQPHKTYLSLVALGWRAKYLSVFAMLTISVRIPFAVTSLTQGQSAGSVGGSSFILLYIGAAAAYISCMWYWWVTFSRVFAPCWK